MRYLNYRERVHTITMSSNIAAERGWKTSRERVQTGASPALSRRRRFEGNEQQAAHANKYVPTVET